MHGHGNEVNLENDWGFLSCKHCYEFLLNSE
jgi:hypothetical protein